MTTFITPKQVTAIKNWNLGTYPKTYIGGSIGSVYTVYGETKAYYFTDNKKNNKLPKWAVE
jgi:hypothetical protein